MRNKRSRCRCYAESGHLRDPGCRLADDLRIQRPPRRLNGSLELNLFLSAAYVSALLLEFVEHPILDGFVADNRLFRRAQSAVIKTLAGENVAHRFRHVRGLLDV